MSAPDTVLQTLGPPFLWGVATSSYQVEGAASADGRAPSIWDTFAARAGTIADGTTGAVACDHYRRWREDVGLMRQMGVGAYRFSVAWPRVIPTGTGAVNERGLAFYDRLVDGLLEAGIQPCATLYHWDLPQALEDRGGWRNRETCFAFVEYTRAVARALGDRVQSWVTINEPWCAAVLGHEAGAHAPGRTDAKESLAVAHHLLLAHGLSMPVLRAETPAAKVGLAHMYVHCMPASESEADALATRTLDGTFNRWYLDVLYGRGYPKDVLSHYVERSVLDADEPPFVEPGDLDAIAAPTDFVGINYYTRAIVRSDRIPEEDNAPRVRHEPPAEERTDMGWEVYPAGLRHALERVHADYAPTSLLVTENGAAYDTGVDDDGRVRDERRVAFLATHLHAVAEAKAAGVPVDGFFAWSLLDNFEWAYGYEKRFGLVHVDFETQTRTLKDSALWYRDVIARVNGGGA